MTPERWQRIRALFDAAAERPPAERMSLLDEACGADDELKREVESLLSASEAAESFLETPAGAFASAAAESEAPGRIGPYEILREIGHGGMGTVYLAARVDQFHKKVALKVVRRGMDTAFIVRRFRNERQILAGLDHPNIARLLDGGTTDDGVPYFVMDYVEGDPIDRYARANSLPVSARLALFRGVCSAVQYAHQNLVVHRDLKPGNILVTSDGTPKLLDFGIAKILLPGSSAETVELTGTALRLLTPEYASPEQVRGERITTSSDVYSLGVLLYELLTDRHPFRTGSLSTDEIVRAVVEKEPGRPSSVRRTLHGDLDNIVGMAMRKEPERRYASVEQLSEDVRRHLEGLPVKARPDTLGYRAGKFVGRHRVGVASAAFVILSLVGGLVATAWEARVARFERARAERRFGDVRRLANSFLFEFHDAILYLPGSTPARALVVKRALQYLGSLSEEAKGDPALQRELAAAYQRVANAQGHIASASLGDTRGARRSYLRALALREELARRHPENDEDQRALAEIYGQVSQLLDSTGDRAGSLAAARKAVALRERLVSSDPSNREWRRGLAVSLHFLGTALSESGDHAAAIEAYGREMALFRELVALDPASARYRWGLACALQGSAQERVIRRDVPAATASVIEALGLLETLNVEKPDHASVRRGLGELHQLLGECRLAGGDRHGAIGEERRALSLREAWCARDPEDADGRNLLAETRCRLGRLLVESGERSEGSSLLSAARTSLEKEAVADAANVEPRRLLGETYLALAIAEEARGGKRPASACELFRKGRDTLLSLANQGKLTDASRPALDEAASRAEACGG